MRRMRLRDDITLTKEMTEGTVLYLSPHYRQLAASGVADEEDIRQNMYNELSMQFSALGITIRSDRETTFSDDQRALMLLVLCPGFFGCSELVEEMAQALRAVNKQRVGKPLASGARGFLRDQSSGSIRAELSASLSDLSRRLSFKRKPKALVLLASTSMSYDEYFRTCPTDLKELGLTEQLFEKWPESPWLQPTAVQSCIYKLPGHHHATRYERAHKLLHRLGGHRASRPPPVLARPVVAAEQRRVSAADLGPPTPPLPPTPLPSPSPPPPMPPRPPQPRLQEDAGSRRATVPDLHHEASTATAGRPGALQLAAGWRRHTRQRGRVAASTQTTRRSSGTSGRGLLIAPSVPVAALPRLQRCLACPRFRIRRGSSQSRVLFRLHLRRRRRPHPPTH